MPRLRAGPYNCQAMNPRALAALSLAAGVLAGCGGTSTTSAQAPTSSAPGALAFSECMRAHGVPGFPDPGASSGGAANTIGGIAIPSSIDLQAPVVASALHGCQGILSRAISRQGRPAITSQMKAKLIAHAQCMRDHGVPVQDPTFPAGGGIAFTDAGVNPQSPAYVHAAAACGAG
jgi:uncharacterized protein YceK